MGDGLPFVCQDSSGRACFGKIEWKGTAQTHRHPSVSSCDEENWRASVVGNWHLLKMVARQF